MKRLFFTALCYLILGLAGGLFYREWTHTAGFTGDTQLSVVHTHLLTLGMMMFLIALILERLFGLTRSRVFGWFYWIYNLGVVWTVAMMVVHGLRTVDGRPDNPALDGISGAGHIILSAGLILLFVTIGRSIHRTVAEADLAGRHRG